MNFVENTPFYKDFTFVFVCFALLLTFFLILHGILHKNDRAFSRSPYGSP